VGPFDHYEILAILEDQDENNLMDKKGRQ